jgi:hypothetical protein
MAGISMIIGWRLAVRHWLAEQDLYKSELETRIGHKEI